MNATIVTVYRARRNGETCHFGEASPARAWAGKSGRVEEIEIHGRPALESVKSSTGHKPVAWRYRDTGGDGEADWKFTIVPPWDWGTRLAIEDQPLYTDQPPDAQIHVRLLVEAIQTHLIHHERGCTYLEPALRNAIRWLEGKG